MTQSTYFTVRICKPSASPLASSTGHSYEYNYLDEAAARVRMERMIAEDNGFDYHLLRTTTEVISTSEAST